MLRSGMVKKTYIEERNGGYWIEGSRVSLDSVVYAFREGRSPEEIVETLPTLSLEQVYGAIATYLANRDDLDTHLAETRSAFARQARRARQADPDFYAKIDLARGRQPA